MKKDLNAETEVVWSEKRGFPNYGFNKFRITEHDIYLCYSPLMRDYLKSRGIKYLCSGKDRRSDTVFYAYYKSDEVNYILHNWENIREGLMSEDQTD